MGKQLMPVQEKNYFVIPCKENRLIFAITARDTKEQDPIILYDGGKHALFYRNKEETIILDYLDNRVKPSLLTGQNIAFTEIDPESEKMVRQYPVQVRIVKKMPKFTLK